MAYFKLTQEERDHILRTKGNTEELFTLIEEIFDETLKWKPGRWWTVLDVNGEIWCETSNEEEAWREHKEKKCSTIHRQYVSEQYSKLVDMTRRSKSD